MHVQSMERPARYRPALAPSRFTRWHRLVNARLAAYEASPAGADAARPLYDCGYSPAQAAAVLA